MSASTPLFVVLNAISGRDDGDESAADIAGELDLARRAHELLHVEDAGRLDEVAQRAAVLAHEVGGAVVAAGGDGTLNAVARAAVERNVPFGLIPLGTFNYFARAHDIPTGRADAVRALLDAVVRPIPVGLVNGRPFFVNASIGLYPEALDKREEEKQHYGRRRLVAAWATLLTVLQRHHTLHLRLERDGREAAIAALTLFVGLNGLQLERMGWDGRVVEHGRLAAIVLRPASPARLLWLLVRGAAGRLPQTQGVDMFTFTRLRVDIRGMRRPVKIALDGETTMMTPPLELTFAPSPLQLLVPRAAGSRP